MKDLIIGFCAAGANAADALRRQAPDAEITVLNGEGRPFYLRLDLEGIFLGKTAGDLMPRPMSYWQEKGIHVIDDRAVELHPTRHQVITASGRTFDYDRLLIATGTRPRVLNCPGREWRGVYPYHTLDDAERIYREREGIRRAVMIGGGILGLEIARVAVHWGWQTTVLVRGHYVGSPMVDADGGEFLLDACRKQGVNVIFGDEVQEFIGSDGRVTGIRTKQGRELPADFTAVCVGVVPNVSFLEGTGILTDSQLIVNEHFETPVADVFAAGDVAQVRLPSGRFVPCNTWHVAVSQARAAAANMSGIRQAWDEGIQYNLDQLFDQELAIIGAWERRHEPGFDLHIRRSPDTYRALVTRDGILVGALLLGSRYGDRRLRKLIAQQAVVEGKIERVFDPESKPEEFASGIL